MRFFWIYIIFGLFTLACKSEGKKEFKTMKPDLDEAAEMYCNCMINADTTENSNPHECREILNTMLLEKTGSNERAREYVQETIRKCVESRSHLEEEEEIKD